MRTDERVQDSRSGPHSGPIPTATASRNDGKARPPQSGLTQAFERVSHLHLVGVLTLVTIYVSLDKYQAGAYNNYLVFAGSLHVLLSGENLYVPHPEYYGDLFKYSPTFPLFMAPMAWLPVPVGIVCWNLVNALALYFAVAWLWQGRRRAFLVTLAILGVELVISLQHIQSNALVAALVILAFIELERARPGRAGFYIAAGFFLKVYGVAAGVLALLYPTRLRTIGTTGLWSATLALAPLVWLSAAELLQQYRNWADVSGTFTLMSNMSLMRVAAMYAPRLDPLVVQAAGAVLFLLPLARMQAFPDPRFRLRLLCSLLIGLVIFNRSAEPPTYVIALAGCGIWYASEEPHRSRLDRALTLPLLAATVLISTDVYPRDLRALAGPWTVKTLGCLMIWLRISVELLAGRYADTGRTSADRVTVPV